jgi:hypothetical protein
VDGQRLTYTCPQQEIETWVEALKFYDNNEFDEALKSFDRISDTSKILFNMGVINATLGQHEQAVRSARLLLIPWVPFSSRHTDIDHRSSATNAPSSSISTSP